MDSLNLFYFFLNFSLDIEEFELKYYFFFPLKYISIKTIESELKLKFLNFANFIPLNLALLKSNYGFATTRYSRFTVTTHLSDFLHGKKSER